MTARYVIDGRRTTTLEAFWTVVGEAVNGPGGYFGTSLDAFGDCLTGGFGTPDHGDLCFVWEDADLARESLGHPETARQLRRRLATCHPSGRARVAELLAEADAGRGETVYDWLVAVFAERGHPVTLQPQ